MNDYVYSENERVNLSCCDPKAVLKLSRALDLFMDAAKNHEDSLGYGLKKLRELDRFWIIGKSRIEFLKKPGIGDEFVLSTWIGRLKHFYIDRQYLICCGEEPMVRGEAQWLLASGGCKNILPVAGFVDTAAVEGNPLVFEEDMPHINKEFLPEEKVGSYRVKASDLDFIGHMNNVAYVRIIEGFLTLDELCGIKKAEMIYSMQCCAGDEMSVFERKSEGILEFGLSFPDGKSAFSLRITLE